MRTCATCRGYHAPFSWCGPTERVVETDEADECALFEDRDFTVRDDGYVMPDHADDERRDSIGK